MYIYEYDIFSQQENKVYEISIIFFHIHEHQKLHFYK